ncbi:hypothetical protein HNP38_000620 [Chryseobacterium defluvii]|uniref:Secretion system C-terminal sorting domain-containing protein n=1 Tax=Chryseobacterium defluvii TaxID=160396 RepID=A0A840KBJ1_9FLAO|nr:T9SS type A sorting domain-containing protein [Chryseobacterium defluvii]MBB4805348.1 hypothetical protein [Chryseobacterium defluvii]
MKKVLFFLFVYSFLSAQNPELFSNSWYISKMVINGQTTTTPAMDAVLPPSSFTADGFYSIYYNYANSNITFSGTSDSFTKNSTVCSLADYLGTNYAAVQDYDMKNCNFYMNSVIGNVFNYEINSAGSTKTLIITDTTTGDKVYYNNSFLSTQDDAVKKSFSVYPNPAKEYLNIKNIDRNLAVKIYDMTGKLVYKDTSDHTTMKIDIRILQKGQYILLIGDYKPYTFIRE